MITVQKNDYSIRQLKKSMTYSIEDYNDLINRLKEVDCNNIDLNTFLNENQNYIDMILYKLNVIRDNQLLLNKDDIYKMNTIMPMILSLLKNIAL